VIRKILKYIVLSVALLIVLAISSALLYRKYLQHRIRAARAITSVNGIDSLDAVRIGGIEQWIHVRGQDVNNPILLFLHGGPGVAFIPLAGTFQGPWEKSFTVVQWDQRGAGKTYASNDKELQRRSMNIPQMQQDTLEVVNYLRSRFKRDKIFVLGHSWGTVLGLWLAHEHPDLTYGFVGTGQVVNVLQNQTVAYQDALRQARALHNEQAIKDLESIAPYPDPMAGLDFRRNGISGQWQAELLGPPSHGLEFTNLKRLLSDVIAAPEYSLADDFAFVRGQLFSLNVFFPQVAGIDLTKLGLVFRTPIFFFEGRNDPFTRPSLIWDYSQTIQAPRVEFVWFENSGHFAFFEEPQKFADELSQRVLPVAH